MSKINVLHLTYDMRIGGTEQVIKNLVENYDHDSFEMSILCIESPIGPFGEALIEKGVRIDALSRQPGFDWRLIRQIRKHLRQHHIDIVHCHQYTPWVYGVLAAFLTKTKVIFTEHGRFYPDFGTRKRRLINPWLHRLTNATTAISKATKEALVVYENLPVDDIQVIYNGIARIKADSAAVTKLRETLNISDDTFILGTIARLDPIKNHLMMLDAFRKVLDTGIKSILIIVGDGEMRPEIEQRVKSLGLEDNVILTGYQTNPQSYLALMDLYLLSSFSEGTSMTLLEAMSLGKPCIVTNAGGNPEIVNHGKNGYVTNNDDMTDFSQYIISVINDPDILKSMSIKSFDEYKARFSINSMATEYASLYKNLKLTIN